MKNYNTTTAATLQVRKRLRPGTSRHKNKQNKLDVITSIGTARNHSNSLKLVADWLIERKGKHLKNMTEEDAAEYLCLRALTVGQSAVDLSRQSINFHLQNENPIPFIPSTIKTQFNDRAYTLGQIDLLTTEAVQKLRLSIALCSDAGLRAHELITISLPCWLSESPRNGWNQNRFIGREHEETFVVHGKGGLCRSVRISRQLTTRLMACMRPAPVIVEDRGVFHRSYFDLTSGANFSSQFSKLSRDTLGFSHGAHGLRHSFAQRRVRELMRRSLSYACALEVLSNELGHFCTSNTFAYLRN